ncbi:MAG: hypothetical protein HN353_08340 [Bdellovibrionales bacterium]|nr:hypothetical protein [Bdellovibrionales bacterium]MBT3526548.1 hypothetical protein [Bdellovibrionales bacterium]MBT7669242.1 hypothetical protein [Bdellovibrionales bacterium]
MNVVDMNNRIGQIKEEQREIQSEMRKGFKAEQKSVKESHDHRTKQQNEIYQERMDKMVKENNSRLKRYDGDTKEAIEGKVKTFKTEIARQRDGFERQRRIENDRLSKELRNVKNSYRRSRQERELNHKNINDRLETRLTDQNMRSKKQFENDIERISKKSHQNMEESREGFSKEKYQIKKDNIERETRLAHEMRKRDITSREKFNKEIDGMRNTYNQEIQGLKDHRQAARDKSIRNNQAENATMLDSFAKRENNIHLVNRVESDRSTALHKESEENLKKGFAKRMNKLNRKALAMAHANDLGVTERLRNERMRNSYESKLKNLKLDLEEEIKASLHQKDNLSEKFKETMQDRNVYNSKKRMENEMRVNLTANKRIGDIKSSRNKVEKYLSDEIEQQQRSFDNHLSTEQDYRKDLLATQRRKFSEKIIDLSETNRSLTNGMRDDYTNEKSEMIDAHKKELHERLRLSNEDHTRKLETIVDGYESRLFTKNQELNRLKALFDTRIKGLEDKSVKDYRREKEMELERSKANSRSSQRTMRTRERTNQKQILSAKRFFDRQILKLKTKNDKDMAKTIRDYESRIEQLNLEGRKKLSNKLQVARDEYLKLVEQSEIKNDALRNQYETRFNKLKMAMEKMKDSRAVNA